MQLGTKCAAPTWGIKPECKPNRNFTLNWFASSYTNLVHSVQMLNQSNKVLAGSLAYNSPAVVRTAKLLIQGLDIHCFMLFNTRRNLSFTARVRVRPKCYIKAALINIFIGTMHQKTICNVKGVVLLGIGGEQNWAKRINKYWTEWINERWCCSVSVGSLLKTSLYKLLCCFCCLLHCPRGPKYELLL